MQRYEECHFLRTENKLEEFGMDVAADDNGNVSHYKRLSFGTLQDNPVTVDPVVPVPCTGFETIVK